MKFGGIGVPELIIILLVALLIFGPKNLPKLGSALGKTVKNLRDGMGAGGKEVEEAIDDPDAQFVDEQEYEELVESEPETASREQQSSQAARKKRSTQSGSRNQSSSRKASTQKKKRTEE